MLCYRYLRAATTVYSKDTNPPIYYLYYEEYSRVLLLLSTALLDLNY